MARCSKSRSPLPSRLIRSPPQPLPYLIHSAPPTTRPPSPRDRRPATSRRRARQITRPAAMPAASTTSAMPSESTQSASCASRRRARWFSSSAATRACASLARPHSPFARSAARTLIAPSKSSSEHLTDCVIYKSYPRAGPPYSVIGKFGVVCACGWWWSPQMAIFDSSILDAGRVDQPQREETKSSGAGEACGILYRAPLGDPNGNGVWRANQGFLMMPKSLSGVVTTYRVVGLTADACVARRRLARARGLTSST